MRDRIRTEFYGRGRVKPKMTEPDEYSSGSVLVSVTDWR